MTSIPLSELVERYIAARPSIKAPRSLKSLRSLPRQFSKHLGREATTADLTPVVLDAWRRELEVEKSEGTAASYINRLLTLWRWAADEGLASDPKQAGDVAPRRGSVGVEVCDKLWRAAEGGDWPVGDFRSNVYWPALLATFWVCSPRIASLRQLRWQRIDLDNGWARFVEGNGSYDAVAPLNALVVDRLRRLWETGAARPFHVPNWIQRWREFMGHAELPIATLINQTRDAGGQVLPINPRLFEGARPESPPQQKTNVRERFDTAKPAKPSGLLGRLGLTS